MRRLLRRIEDQSGFSLPLSLGIMLALSASTVTVMSFTTASQRHASTSNAGQKAFQLAEAGVNNAAGVLGKPENVATTATLLTPSVSERVQCVDAVNWCFQNVLDGGKAQWYGTYESSIQKWTIHSWGIVDNPTSSALDVVRKLKAEITLYPDPTQPVNATAWNFVIAGRTSNSTTCDMEITQSAHIDASLYVAGNLCLRNSAKIYQPDDNAPVDLIVAGKLEVEQGTQPTKSKVGESSVATDYIQLAEIVGGCTTNITQAAHTCDPAVGDRVWATTLRNTSTVTITQPTPDWTYWYNNANPGPTKPCNPTSSSPVFDNNAVLDFAAAPNGSIPTSFNLTPTTGSYTCTGYDSATGRLVGELSWNHTTKKLKILGVVYIDGSAYISNNLTNEYDGQGNLYLSGTFTLSGGTTRLCARIHPTNTTDCYWTTTTGEGWDPNQEMFIVNAHGDNGTGSSVSFSNAVQFQGALFATNAIDLGSAAHAEGPMIGATVRLAQSVQIKPLPLVDTLPLGAPGNPNTHASPGKAVYVK